MYVVVLARKDGGTLIAKKIFAKGDNDDFHDFVVKGVIKSLDAGAMLLGTRKGDIEFEINSSTEVVHQNGDDATLADLKNGLLVAVAGEGDKESAVAINIVILDGVKRPERGEFELEGIVISTDADTQSFDIRQRRGAEITVYTDGNTSIVNADGSVATFDNIAEGLFVAVQGKPSNDGLLASEVQLYNESHEAGIVGRVLSGRNTSAAGGTKFVLRGPDIRRVVSANRATRVRFADGTRGSLADISKGTPVLVEATGKGNRITASKVVILKNRGAIIRVTGKVVSTRNGRLTLRVNRRVVVFRAQASTVVLLQSGRAIRFGNLRAGAEVLVVGYRNNGARNVTMIRSVG
jgi:hypothetical protein